MMIDDGDDDDDTHNDDSTVRPHISEALWQLLGRRSQ